MCPFRTVHIEVLEKVSKNNIKKMSRFSKLPLRTAVNHR